MFYVLSHETSMFYVLSHSIISCLPPKTSAFSGLNSICLLFQPDEQSGTELQWTDQFLNYYKFSQLISQVHLIPNLHWCKVQWIVDSWIIPIALLEYGPLLPSYGA